jgi:cytochrome P450
MSETRAPYLARGVPFLGALLRLRTDPLGTLEQLSRAHAGVIQLKPRWYFVSSPDDLQRVMAGPVHYTKGAFSKSVARTMVDPLADLLGEGLLNSEGELWKKQRKLSQQAFSRPRLRLLIPAMVGAAQALVERWNGAMRRSESVEAVEEMRQVALDAMSRTIFSTPITVARGLGDAFSEALVEAVVITNEEFWSIVPIPVWLPTPSNLRWRRLMRTIDAGVARRIEERRQEGGPGDDLLSAFMTARNEQTGEGMSDRHLRDEVLTLMVAGHDSTAQALCWTLHLLAEHPGAAARARAELDEVLGDRPPTADDLPRLTYLTCVLHESMRLYPPAWMLVRSPTTEDLVGGCRIPARAVVISSPYATHRRPDLWEDPERFDPERFTAERSAGRPRYAYFPFGGGGRQCIGNLFALQEMQIVVAMLLQRFELRPAPGRRVEVKAALTLRPKRGLPLHLSPRRSR